jgi:hypothetical protein
MTKQRVRRRRSASLSLSLLTLTRADTHLLFFAPSYPFIDVGLAILPINMPSVLRERPPRNASRVKSIDDDDDDVVHPETAIKKR